VAKEEWGSKRTCPKCNTRFYDLQNDNPLTCIDCGHEWAPEPILKTKQPIVVEDDEEEDEDDDDDDDLDIDEDDDSSGDESLDDDSSEVAGMIDTTLEKSDD